ncbi:MAG: hypothetical protein EBQ96_01260 [Proteobacteria bacterium]|nr:hypothetical protein [Pseudomonadota bacterium]
MQGSVRFKNYVTYGLAVAVGAATPHLACFVLWGLVALDAAIGIGIMPQGYSHQSFANARALGLSPFEYIVQFCSALRS